YVLKALGVGEEVARGSIRIGLGRFTTETEINYAIGAFAEKVEKLRGQGARPGLEPAATG
ncbi:MAG: hypothetical protein ACPHIA_08715, partial [Alphaproteobacteria bacterium]